MQFLLSGKILILLLVLSALLVPPPAAVGSDWDYCTLKCTNWFGFGTCKSSIVSCPTVICSDGQCDGRDAIARCIDVGPGGPTDPESGIVNLVLPCGTGGGDGGGPGGWPFFGLSQQPDPESPWHWALVETVHQGGRSSLGTLAASSSEAAQLLKNRGVELVTLASRPARELSFFADHSCLATEELRSHGGFKTSKPARAQTEASWTPQSLSSFANFAHMVAFVSGDSTGVRQIQVEFVSPPTAEPALRRALLGGLSYAPSSPGVVAESIVYIWASPGQELGISVTTIGKK